MYINGYTMEEYSSFSAEVKSSISAYFLQREPYVRGLSIDNDRYDRISVFNISSICNDIAEGVSSYFDGVVLKKDEAVIDSYSLGRGELSRLNKIYINGVEV